MMRTNIVLPNIPKVSAHRGFTLMEILIAIFIFGIIVSTIFGSFHAVFSQTEAITNDSALYEMGRNCMNRMVVDLQAIHAALPPQYSEPTEDDDPDPFRFVSEIKQIDQKEFPMLRFTSRSHVAWKAPGRAVSAVGSPAGIGFQRSPILASACDDRSDRLCRLLPHRR